MAENFAPQQLFEEEGVMFFSKKFVALFLVAITLLLQGCATSGTGKQGGANLLCGPQNYQGPDGHWYRREGTGGCGNSQFWTEFGSEYDEIRARGGRLAPDGKSILTPTETRGVFEDQHGYRVLHQLDCNRPGAGSRIFGFFLDAAAIAVSSPWAQRGAILASQTVEKQAAHSRYYNCEELKEMLNAGNAVFYQKLAAQQQAREMLVSPQQVNPIVQATELIANPVLASCVPAIRARNPEVFPESMSVQEVLDGMSRRCELAGRVDFGILPNGKCGCTG